MVSEWFYLPRTETRRQATHTRHRQPLQSFKYTNCVMGPNKRFPFRQARQIGSKGFFVWPGQLVGLALAQIVQKQRRAQRSRRIYLHLNVWVMDSHFVEVYRCYFLIIKWPSPALPPCFCCCWIRQQHLLGMRCRDVSVEDPILCLGGDATRLSDNLSRHIRNLWERIFLWNMCNCFSSLVKMNTTIHKHFPVSFTHWFILTEPV